MELWRISDVPYDVAAKQRVICRSKDRGMQVTDIRREKYAQTQIRLGRKGRKEGRIDLDDAGSVQHLGVFPGHCHETSCPMRFSI